jgi:hypothetical protein
MFFFRIIHVRQAGYVSLSVFFWGGSFGNQSTILVEYIIYFRSQFLFVLPTISNTFVFVKSKKIPGT